jgi:hypothetical protein
MNEEILQYIWNYKKFLNFDFISTDGRIIEIPEFGEWNKNSGPDFLLPKLKLTTSFLQEISRFIPKRRIGFSQSFRKS